MKVANRNRVIGPKAAEAHIPGWREMIGNYALREHLAACIESNDPEDDPNLMVIGEPGTGKTSILISYLRERLADPALGFKSHEPLFAVLSLRQYAFVRIDGASVGESRLRELVGVVTGICGVEHTFVLLDEAGELYFRRLDEPLRPMLDSPQVTTLATAQNFHSRRRTDTTDENDSRLRAFLRRFRIRLRTELPTEEEMAQHVISIMKEWDLKCNEPEAIHALLRKSSGIVGFANGCLVEALARPDRSLTHAQVMRYTADPLLE